ncbi:MAG: hypothetical protein AAF943_02655 [Pseudomonadota bacterium]
MTIVPTTFEEWKHCITVRCDIPLTQDYVSERLTALNDLSDYHTQKFIDRWGDAHHAQTVAWFEKAAEDLAKG